MANALVGAAIWATIEPTTTVAEALMPSTLNSSTPYSWFKRVGIPMIVAAIVGYLYGIGAFGDQVATGTPPPAGCTTTTTTPGR